MADPNADLRRQQFAALEKEWMAQYVHLSYANWLQHELVKARAAQPSSADMEKLARELDIVVAAYGPNELEPLIEKFRQLLTSTLGTK